MINLLPWLARGAAMGVIAAWLLRKEKDMFDCSKEITEFHDDKVNLPEATRALMRDRRNTNRDRLKAGLEKNDDPSPQEFVSQGSYAMRTMTQADDNDVDIDDGAYFLIDDLDGKTPRATRKMIWEAVKDDKFKTEPIIKDNCVRVIYNEGYQVDIPAYRKVVENGIFGEKTYYELASKDEWRRSDPRSVTNWFVEANKELSPDDTNGGQMRRIVRLLKDYAKSDSSWKGKGPSGFIISKLVIDEFVAHEGRDDKSLYYTMRNIRNRLQNDLEVEHPVPDIDEMLTEGPDDPTTKFFKDRLDEAIDELEVLFTTDDADEALSAWGTVFNEKEYFSQLAENREQDAEADKNSAVDDDIAAEGVWAKPANNDDGIPAVDKKGGGRYA